MKVSIDEVKCIGCGLCEELLPEVFTTGAYRARVKRPSLLREEEESACEAAEDCPARAISFSEDDEAPTEGSAGQS
jgi:ferredoxin